MHSHRQAKDFFEQSRADDDCNNARMPLSLSDLKRTRPTCGRERRSWRVDQAWLVCFDVCSLLSQAGCMLVKRFILLAVLFAS